MRKMTTIINKILNYRKYCKRTFGVYPNKICLPADMSHNDRRLLYPLIMRKSEKQYFVEVIFNMEITWTLKR